MLFHEAYGKWRGVATFVVICVCVAYGGSRWSVMELLRAQDGRSVNSCCASAGCFNWWRMFTTLVCFHCFECWIIQAVTGICRLWHACDRWFNRSLLYIYRFYRGNLKVVHAKRSRLNTWTGLQLDGDGGLRQSLDYWNVNQREPEVWLSGCPKFGFTMNTRNL